MHETLFLAFLTANTARILLRARLAVFERESAVLPRRAAPEASFRREAATWSSEAELEAMESEQFSLSRGKQFSRLSCTQPGGTGRFFLWVGGYFIYRGPGVLKVGGSLLRPTLSLWKFWHTPLRSSASIGRMSLANPSHQSSTSVSSVALVRARRGESSPSSLTCTTRLPGLGSSPSPLV